MVGDEDGKMALRLNSDRCRVYLDATMAPRPSDYLMKLVQLNDPGTLRGSACLATATFLENQKETPRSRASNTKQSTKGAGEKSLGSV